MKNFLLFIFGKIFPKTVFEQLNKFVKKLNFDRNQLKVSTQLKYTYFHQEKILR